MGDYLKWIPLVLIIFFAAGHLVTVPLAMLGQLIGGLLSGYKLVFFSLYGKRFVKRDGRFVKRDFGANGHGGMAMSPPEPVNGTFPVALYFYGGNVMLIIAAAVFCVLCLILRGRLSWLSFIFGVVAATNLFFVVIIYEQSKQNVRAEMLFLEIIGERRPEEMTRLYNIEMVNYLNRRPVNLDKLKLQYAQARIIAKEDAKAAEILKKINKVCGSYVFPQSVEDVREWVGIIDRIAGAM